MDLILRLVSDIYPGSTDSSPGNFTILDNHFYFTATAPPISEGFSNRGFELFVSDGTSEGTRLVADINPGSRSSSPSSLTIFQDEIYFQANNFLNGGTELYASNGTVEGTRLVADINPGSTGSFPRNFTVLNDQLYFSAIDSRSATPVGEELYVSDGTTEGTRLVADIRPGSSGSLIRYPVAYNDLLYFQANNGINGEELYVSDGTTEGTRLVADINPGNGSSSPSFLTVYNNLIYFVANNGINGEALYVSDGTTEGTELVADINPGSNTSLVFTDGLVVFNNKLYFVANDGINGTELYESDGSSAGTILAVDLNPSGSSQMAGLRVFNNKLYFVGTRTDFSQRQVYESDGTESGTTSFTDRIVNTHLFRVSSGQPILPGIVFDDNFYTNANRQSTGRELYRIEQYIPITLQFGQVPNKLKMEASIDGTLIGREDGSQNGIVPNVNPFSIFAVDSVDTNPSRENFIDRTWFDQGEGIGIQDGDDNTPAKRKKVDGDEILGISVTGYNATEADVNLFKIDSEDGSEIQIQALFEGNIVDSEVISLERGLIKNQTLNFISDSSFDTLHISAKDSDTTFHFKTVILSVFEI